MRGAPCQAPEGYSGYVYRAGDHWQDGEGEVIGGDAGKVLDVKLTQRGFGLEGENADN